LGHIPSPITPPAKGLGRLLLLTLLWLPLLAPAADLGGRVIAVPDANRIILLTQDNRRLPIALRGLKVPGAVNGKWRKIGRRHLRMLVAGRQVSVDTATHGATGVILGDVRHGGANVGLRLLRSGLAVTNNDNTLPSALKRAYREAELEARRRGMGFWQTTR
jgi:endonuclease YncB( thermonuclease family)